MRALVVYETMWGNTGEIAASIADGIRTREVAVASAGRGRAGGRGAPRDVDLLVVGGPTHAFSMSTA